MEGGGHVVMSMLVCSACVSSVRNRVFLTRGFHCPCLGSPTFFGARPDPEPDCKGTPRLCDTPCYFKDALKKLCY